MATVTAAFAGVAGYMASIRSLRDSDKLLGKYAAESVLRRWFAARSAWLLVQLLSLNHRAHSRFDIT
jgi:hypothetical protein